MMTPQISFSQGIIINREREEGVQQVMEVLVASTKKEASSGREHRQTR